VVPIQAAFGGGDSDVLVTRLNSTGSALLYSTYLGGWGVDSAAAIGVDGSGNAYVAGSTYSTDFPLVDPIQSQRRGGYCTWDLCYYSAFLPCFDAFVAKLSASGSALIYSTYLGGEENDRISALAVGGDGSVYVAGSSVSTDFPAVPPRTTPRGVFVARITEAALRPVFSAVSVVNGASFAPGLVPGGITTVFGVGLTNGGGITLATGFPLPYELNGTSVTIDGVRAPLLGVANVNGQEQINLVAPSEITSRSTVTVTVTRDGLVSDAVQVAVSPPRPGIFTYAGGWGAIQHASDFALVTDANPAARNEAVIIYCTGLGPVEPPVPTGVGAPAFLLSTTVLRPRVTVGGIPAEVLFSGLTPGYAGLYQVNIQVPANLAPGYAGVIMTVDNEVSKIVALAVR
jgi:uncharacterized protein (TIGR03437 family)